MPLEAMPTAISGEQRTSSVLEIPELAIKILALLPVKDLLSAASVCQAWHMHCSDILYTTQEVPFAFIYERLLSFSEVRTPSDVIYKTDRPPPQQASHDPSGTRRLGEHCPIQIRDAWLTYKERVLNRIRSLWYNRNIDLGVLKETLAIFDTTVPLFPSATSLKLHGGSWTQETLHLLCSPALSTLTSDWEVGRAIEISFPQLEAIPSGTPHPNQGVPCIQKA